MNKNFSSISKWIGEIYVFDHFLRGHDASPLTTHPQQHGSKPVEMSSLAVETYRRSIFCR